MKKQFCIVGGLLLLGVVAVAQTTNLFPRIGYQNMIISQVTNAIAFGGGPPPGEPINLSSNLYAWWNMDNGSTWPDVSGNSRPLTEGGSVLAVAGGISTNAAEFTDTSGQYLNRADSDLFTLGTNGFTVTAWATLGSTNDTEYVVCKDRNNPGDREWNMAYSAIVNQFRFAVATNNVTTVSAVPPMVGINMTNEWYFMVGMYNPTNSTIRTKIGVRSSAVLSGWGDQVISQLPTNTTFSVRVGNTASATSTPYDGLIDEVGIWNRMLNDTEINQIFTNGVAGIAYPYP